MKKKAGIAVAVLVLLAAAYAILPGFTKSTSAYIGDYALSADGTEMTIRLDVGSSAGYIRKVTVKAQQNGNLYLDCYAAFGGWNGSIGAKREFSIPIGKDTKRIALYRNTDCYEEVLQKDSRGEWQRV